MVEVSMLSSHCALPRVGHLEAAYQVFAYLRKHSASTLVFHPVTPEPTRLHQLAASREEQDWRQFYADAVEQTPEGAPAARGNAIDVSAFVDADHAGNLINRRSQTGFILFCNGAPIVWYSKKQNTVESSTFGSEMLAMRSCLEAIEALRTKLRWFGVPVTGTTPVYCDNDSLVKSTTRPEAQITKKHLAISYHRIREAVAAGTIYVVKEDTKTNLADLLTKCLDNVKRGCLIPHLLLNWRGPP